MSDTLKEMKKEFADELAEGGSFWRNTEKEHYSAYKKVIDSVLPDDELHYEEVRNKEKRGNGGATHYYELPKGATELKHLIKHKRMEHGIGEAFCALYRLHDNGEYERNLKKAKFYIDSELEYLQKENK